MPDGGIYHGSIDERLRPHGFGQTYYPTNHGSSRKNTSRQVKYAGDFKEGLRHGRGKEYYPDGRLAYKGYFKDDFMDGSGVMYYQVK